MKKITSSIIISLLGIILYTNAELIISSSDIKILIDKGYILSDNYNQFTECINAKEKYNIEYSNYKRTDCFGDGGGFKYFICESSKDCNLNTILTSTKSDDNLNSQANTTDTTNNNTLEKKIDTKIDTSNNILNKAKLDNFLKKIENKEEELNNDIKYEKLLNQVYDKLEEFGVKYENNNNISQMIDYLKIGITDIKKKPFKNIKDITLKYSTEELYKILLSEYKLDPKNSKETVEKVAYEIYNNNFSKYNLSELQDISNPISKKFIQAIYIKLEYTKETVTCYFSGSTKTENCSSSYYDYISKKTRIFSCSSIGKCIATIEGPKGIKLEWDSSLKTRLSYNTIIDGQDETVSFVPFKIDMPFGKCGILNYQVFSSINDLKSTGESKLCTVGKPNNFTENNQKLFWNCGEEKQINPIKTINVGCYGYKIK